MIRRTLIFLTFSLTALSAANAQTMRLAFTSDDFVVTPVFNNVAQFTFDIEIDAPLAPGVYANPDIVSVVYTVSGDLVNPTPSTFPSFALRREITGAEFYAQGSSLAFEVQAGAVLSDGVQFAELVGSGLAFTFNGNEIDNGRFHPALLELNADGTGTIQNSDNVISQNPFQQVNFGEEYITNLMFDPGNLTLLTAVVEDPDPPLTFGGGGNLSPQFLFVFLLMIIFSRRSLAKSKSRHYRFTGFLLVIASLVPFTANAEIFKCVAENGELTFSQAPCVEKGSTVTVMKSGGSTSNEPADCEHARRFALNTAQKMKTGTGSRTIFDSYGGIGALSKGSVSLISYVYQFRTNDDVSAVRVSALATAKCQARAFGDVSCEQLPSSFTNGIGGCNIDEGEMVETASARATTIGTSNTQLTHLQPLVTHPPSRSSQDSGADQRARAREAKALEEKQRLNCRDRIKSQIEGINARMRSGYSSAQGETFKNQRRNLEERMRDC